MKTSRCTCHKFEGLLIRIGALIHHYSTPLRGISFIGIALTIFGIINFIAEPFWNNFDTLYGFYEEPKDTIETIFLGTSHVKAGVSPMYLYEKYGICSFDISTDGQPILASYYWLEEVYRLHSETLSTVVLDVSSLRMERSSASYNRALDSMHFSTVKLRGVKAYSKDFTDFLFNIIPVFDYHERWKELTDEDFLKYGYKPILCYRGYSYRITQWLNNKAFYDLNTPLLILNENEGEKSLNDTAVKYLKKMISFCEDHDITLILIKTPTEWSSADHNAVQTLADTYGIDFIDFNIDPYYTIINFNIATDVTSGTPDNLHANYYGAIKLSDFLGEYLIEKCDNKNFKGNASYTHMNQELYDYKRYIADIKFMQYIDPCAYIAYALQQGDYTIFISVKDEAADTLKDKQRSYFASIGLEKLSKLTHESSYLAVIENGNVKEEITMPNLGEDNVTEGPLEYTGTLQDGIDYSLISGGYDQGNKSSIKIDGTERSSNNRGLNIVIYDNKRHEYIDSANFDTHISPEREIQNVELRLKAELDDGYSLSELSGTDRTLYLYDRRCENDKNVKLIRQSMDDNDIIEYLDAFIDDKDLDIYISVKNDASQIINSDTGNELEEKFGLTELSGIGYQDSYIALISGGDVIFEEKGHGKDGIEVKNDKYYLSSCGTETEDGSSIMIDGTEYSDNEDGINIVVYDNITEMVIDTVSFGMTDDDITTAEETAA